MTQGARICPHCKRRVDERRAKGLAYCLSCGQPLAGFARTSGPPSNTPPASLQYGTPPPSQYGVPPSQYGAAASPYAGPPSPAQVGGPSSMPYGAPGSPSYNPPGPNYGNAQQPYLVQPAPARSGSGSTALVLGIVFGLTGLLALFGAVIFFLAKPSSSSSSSSTSADTPPTSTVAVESTAAATTDDTAPTPTATHHAKPLPTPSTKSTDDTPPNVLPPFPIDRALLRMDDAVLSAERICPHREGPFGTTLVEIDFEPDGRTGTVSHIPIGGTPTGDCVTAQFLAIRLGPFQGFRRTFSRAVTIKSPTGTTAPTTTATTSATNRATRPDAGH